MATDHLLMAAELSRIAICSARSSAYRCFREIDESLSSPMSPRVAELLSKSLTAAKHRLLDNIVKFVDGFAPCTDERFASCGGSTQPISPFEFNDTEFD